MKNFMLFLSLMLVASIGINGYAQQRPNHQGNHNNNHPSFEQFMNEKISFLVKEMKLSSADSVQFVTIYHEMLTEKGNLMKRHRGDRELVHKIHKGEPVKDEQYIQIVMDEADLQVEDAQLQKKYLERFSKVLTARQLFDYNLAEKKFRNNLMKRGENMRRPNGSSK